MLGHSLKKETRTNSEAWGLPSLTRQILERARKQGGIFKVMTSTWLHLADRGVMARGLNSCTPLQSVAVTPSGHLDLGLGECKAALHAGLLLPP